ncbi:MAG TPA: hypothetical protein VN623_10515 [Hyphomicrobium sp.]|jgi:hypothetical protein|uniref:hypothetical protein n=1 Tax=Hyphomicrobium sp. TaxID=82 RepID=UPI002B723226|nr:hypothetical protein [Hyphomicrobium sp.]HXE02369.1 hypothetical protein [Hyphomicrobium sp.]
MSSLMGSLLAVAAAVCATVLAAAAHQPPLHMAVAGVAGLALTFMAIRDRQRLMFAGATTSAVASSTARHLGIVWAWAALAVAASYLLIIEARWPEWWQFFIGFGFAAIASFVFASMLDRDAAAGRGDDTLVKFGRLLVQVQIVGMAAGIISLFVDGKFPRAVNHADWAGCSIFFFGALAIAAISLDALRSPARV